MKISTTLAILLSLWMVACAPTEAASARTASLDKSVAILTGAPAFANDPTPQPLQISPTKNTANMIVAETAIEAEDDNMAEINGQRINDASTNSEPVQPVTINLSNLAEETGRDGLVEGSPQEMPMPGVPDQAVILVNNVRQDLARQLNIDMSETTWLETEAIDWADGSLGCPQPDMAYDAVITPGYRITVEAENKTFVYHTDSNNTFVLCQK